MHRCPRRALALLSLLALAACTGGAGDMGADDDMGAPPDLGGDMAVDLTIKPGALGAACTDDDACSGVQDGLCFRANLFNNPLFLPTPGGYCSRRCFADADCGPTGLCQDFGLAGYCFARCDTAATCRHPGYACTLSEGVCFPDALWDCNPREGGGACQAQVDTDPMAPKVPGGCLRQTLEDLGRCAPACEIGTATCPIDPQTVESRHCVYIDSTVDLKLEPTGDLYRGLLCLPDTLPAVGDDKPCRYFEDCREGSQCDLYPGGDSRCHKLCVQGGTPTCMAGSCQDRLNAGAGGPGLCKE